MSDMTLYLCQFTCSMASHIMLTELGADFSAVHVSLPDGEHMGSEYQKINPHGEVPALKIGDEVISENVAIATWLDLTYPQAGVLPGKTPMEKAQTMSLFGWLNSSLHRHFTHMFLPDRFADESVSEQIVQRAGERALACFADLDKRLANQDWLAGDFSYLDAYLFVLTNWAENVHGLDIAHKAPNVFAHLERMKARDSVQKILAREAELAAA